MQVVEPTLAVISLAVLLSMVMYAAGLFRAQRLSHRLAVMLFPISQMLIAALLFGAAVHAHLGLGLVVAVSIVCLLCTGADVLLLRTLRSSGGRALAEERVRLLEEQAQAQRRYAEWLESETARADGIRSDLVQELEGIERALDAGGEGVSHRISEARRILSAPVRMMCQHKTVNALCAIKSHECDEAGVMATFELDVPSDLPFSSVDLCALFANMLDNALRACEKVEKGRRFIEAKAGVRAGMFVAEVRNSCADDGAESSEQGGFTASSRRATGLDEHGWGLVILEDIASRHGGTLETEQRAGIYRTTVVLAVQV